MKALLEHNWISAAVESLKYVMLTNPSKAQAASMKLAKNQIPDIYPPYETFEKWGNGKIAVDTRWTSGIVDDDGEGAYVKFDHGKLVIVDKSDSVAVSKVFRLPVVLDADNDWFEFETQFDDCDYIEFDFLDGSVLDPHALVAMLTIEDGVLNAYNGSDDATGCGDISEQRHLIKVKFDFTNQTFTVYLDGTAVASSLSMWQFYEENVDDMAEDAYPPVHDATSWAQTHVDTATLYMKAVTDAGTDKHIKILDNDPVNAINETFTLHYIRTAALSAPFNVIDMDLKAITGNATYCLSYIDLYDNANALWISFRINHNTGDIYYGTDGTTYASDTGSNLTIGSYTNFAVSLTANNKCKISIDSGALGSELTAVGAYSAGIKKIKFRTLAINQTPEVQYPETFEAWTDGDNPDHDVTPAGETYMLWQVYAEGAAAHFTVEQETLGGVASKWGYYYQLTVNDKYLRAYGKFNTASPETPAAQNYKVAFDLYVTSTRANVRFCETVHTAWNAPGTERVQIWAGSNGNWNQADAASAILWSAASKAWVINTLYHCVVWFISASQFKLSIDGGSTWSDATNNSGGNWANTIKEIWHYGAGSYTQQFYIDNIETNWTRDAAATQQIELYIDNICHVHPQSVGGFEFKTSDAAEDVEVYLYSFKDSMSSTLLDIDADDFDALLDCFVQIYDDEIPDFLWCGYVTEVIGTNPLELRMKDASLLLETTPSRENHSRFNPDTDPVCAHVDNKNQIVFDDADYDAAGLLGCGAIITFGDGIDEYTSDAAPNASLKCASVVASQGTQTNAVANTETKEGTSHQYTTTTAAPGWGVLPYVQYGMTGASTVAGVIEKLNLNIKVTGRCEFWRGRKNRIDYSTRTPPLLVVSMYHYTDARWYTIYEACGRLAQETSYGVYTWDIDTKRAITQGSIASGFVTNAATAPAAIIMFSITNPTEARVQTDNWIKVDYCRVEMRVINRKHDPVVAPICALSSAGAPADTTATVMSAPMFDGYIDSGDLIQIGDSVDVALSEVLRTVPSSIVETKPYQFIVQDFRGFYLNEKLQFITNKLGSKYGFNVDRHGQLGLFMNNYDVQHFAEFFTAGDGINVDGNCSGWDASLAGAGTIKCDLHADYGQCMEVLNTTANSMYIMHSLINMSCPKIRSYEFGIQMGSTNPGTKPVRMFFQTYDSGIVYDTIEIFFDQNRKVYVTDDDGTSSALQIAAADITVPTNDFALFKIVFTSSTTYDLYCMRGVSGDSDNDSIWTKIVDGRSCTNNGIRWVKYLFEENASVTNLTVRFNCIKWIAEKKIGTYHTDPEAFSIDENLAYNILTLFTASIGIGSYDANRFDKIVAHPTISGRKVWHVKNAKSGSGMAIFIGKDVNEDTFYIKMRVMLHELVAVANATWLTFFYGEYDATHYAFVGFQKSATGVDIKQYGSDTLLGTFPLDEFHDVDIYVNVTTIRVDLDGVKGSEVAMFKPFTAGNGAEDISIQFGNAGAALKWDTYFEGLDASFLSGKKTKEVVAAPGTVPSKEASSIRSVTVLGKKIDYEITIPDVSNPDPSESLGDSTSFRDLFIVDNEINDPLTIRDYAKAIIEGCSENLAFYSVFLSGVDLDGDREHYNIKVGDFLRFKDDHGVWHLNEYVRRTEFSWDNESNKKVWKIECGKGNTMGVEKLSRRLQSSDFRIKMMGKNT